MRMNPQDLIPKFWLHCKNCGWEGDDTERLLNSHDELACPDCTSVNLLQIGKYDAQTNTFVGSENNGIPPEFM